MMIQITAKKISKFFNQKRVFKNLDFHLEPGCYGIAGANGSGKSTLLKCMAGLMGPSEGELTWYHQKKAVAAKDLNQFIGYAAPYINLYHELTVYENLKFLAQLRAINPNSASVQQWIEFMEVSSFLHQPAGNLSTGQQQRAKLLTAVFFNPQALFLDEPGSNMDEAGRNLIRKITTRWQKEGKLLILASNQMTELNLCEAVLTIDDINPEFLTR